MNWTPNDTIVVAVIGAVGTVLSAVLPKYMERRDAKKAEASKPSPAPETPPTARRLEPANASPSRPEIVELSIREVAENIEKVPPFQRDAITQHYVGLRVCWPARLGSIDRVSPDSMQISVHFLEGRTLGFCQATPKDVTGVIHAPEGTLVDVTGALKRISRYEVDLSDCSIRPNQGMPTPYEESVLNSPNAAIVAAWQDIEKAALRLMDGKILRTDRSMPIPIGAVAEALRFKDAINQRNYDTLLALGAIGAKAAEAKPEDGSPSNARNYCRSAIELIDYLQSQ